MPGRLDVVFDLVNGLPLHPLVVHAVVVLIPLVLVGVVLMLVRRRWRRTLGWWLVLLSAVLVPLSWLAEESGGALAERVGDPEFHAELGETMPLVSGVLFLAVLVFVVVDRLLDRGTVDAGPGTSGWVVAVGLVAVVIAGAATVQVFRVGESGAAAVWQDQV